MITLHGSIPFRAKQLSEHNVRVWNSELKEKKMELRRLWKKQVANQNDNSIDARYKKIHFQYPKSVNSARKKRLAILKRHFKRQNIWIDLLDLSGTKYENLSYKDRTAQTSQRPRILCHGGPLPGVGED